MDEVLNLIKKNSGKITFKNILNKVNIPRDELLDIIRELKLNGKILQVDNKFKIFPDYLKLGTVTISSSGRKYIYYENERIPITANFSEDLFLNDTVSFTINNNLEAEIVTIVDRPLGKTTCEIKVVNGKKEIIPFHSGIRFKFNSKILEKLDDGDIIIVKIDPNNLYEIPEAEYIGKLGRRDDPLIADAAIALNFGFDNNYSKEYLEEIEKYPTSVSSEDTKGRTDYRDQKSFTIDGIDTKDMDDGVFGEKIDNDIIRIYVHIASVDDYIKLGSLAFLRACEKTTSLYLNNSVFHMFHRLISNGICSLNEGKDRLTKTVVMDIDKDGHIVNYEINRSVINSKKKMTYEDVDQILMEGKMVPGYENFEKELTILYEAALRLEKRFINENRKLTFKNLDPDITYNSDGTIKSIANKDNSLARKIIEYIMLAANETVAKWFITMDMACIFRIHEFPSVKKINEVIDILNENGYRIKHVKNVEDNSTMFKILEELSKYDEFDVISQMLVMRMQRARYSIQNLGHYALGFLAYLHFTSPIRRLADLLVHMLVTMILTEPEKLTPEYLSKITEKLKELAKRASIMERQADSAERIAENREIINYLARNKNVDYEASVVELGSNVKLRIDGVETQIDSRELNKFLGYDSKRKRYYDRETGSHLKIGSKVYVRITDVDCVNDRFSVKITGICPTASKKKVLAKSSN